MKRTLPAVMTVNGTPPVSSTMPRRGLKATESEVDALLFRAELAARIQSQQQSPQSSNRSSSAASWNMVSSGGSDRWTAPGHYSPSLGLFTNNGALMQQQQQQHNIAADLLADCRIPESSL